MIKNVFIPGFATRPFLFEDIKACIGNLEIVELNDFGYNETKNLLDNLKNSCDRINIIAWSLGALFALRWTLDNPKTVNSLYLLGATSCFIQKSDYHNGITSTVVERMVRLINAGKKRLVLNDFYNNTFYYVKNKDTIIKKLLEFDFAESVLINGLNELLGTDLRGELNKIDCRIRLAHGLQDAITPLYGAEFIKNNTKHSTLNVVECGHAYFLEDGDGFIRELKEFVNDQLC